MSDSRDQNDNRLDQMDPCSPEGSHPEQGPAGGPVCVFWLQSECLSAALPVRNINITDRNSAVFRCFCFPAGRVSRRTGSVYVPVWELNWFHFIAERLNCCSPESRESPGGCVFVCWPVKNSFVCLQLDKKVHCPQRMNPNMFISSAHKTLNYFSIILCFSLMELSARGWITAV